MANLTPLQLLLWIAGLGMILVPLFYIAVNMMYKAKERHMYNIFSNFSKAFECALKAMREEMKKKKKENEEDSEK